MEDRLDRKIYKEAAAVKPTRSFRYEDYSTRRVFLRSYPLQWESPGPGADEKPGQGYVAAGEVGEELYEHRDRKWVAVVVEWGEDQLLLLRRVKKRLALYLLGCHYSGGRPALKYKSGGPCTTAMLKSM